MTIQRFWGGYMPNLSRCIEIGQFRRTECWNE